jgi:hypothetical protein
LTKLIRLHNPIHESGKRFLGRRTTVASIILSVKRTKDHNFSERIRPPVVRLEAREVVVGDERLRGKEHRHNEVVDGPPEDGDVAAFSFFLFTE